MELSVRLHSVQGYGVQGYRAVGFSPSMGPYKDTPYIPLIYRLYTLYKLRAHTSESFNTGPTTLRNFATSQAVLHRAQGDAASSSRPSQSEEEAVSRFKRITCDFQALEIRKELVGVYPQILGDRFRGSRRV